MGTAVAAKIREEKGSTSDAWGDDGFVVNPT
jgi:hypothetical protein